MHLWYEFENPMSPRSRVDMFTYPASVVIIISHHPFTAEEVKGVTVMLCLRFVTLLYSIVHCIV